VGDIYAPLLSGLVWRKARASGTGNCVQVSVGAVSADEIVLVRDSKDPDGPHLRFTSREWDCFLTGVRDGEFARAELRTLRENG
jgi:hypothetical protein